MNNPFVNLKHKVDFEKEIVATYRVESVLGIEDAANAIAEESSIGTWTKVENLGKAVGRGLAPSVYFIDKKKKIIKIAYPLDLFELGNVSQLLSSIGGNVFSLKAIKSLRLVDIDLPAKYVKSFCGPFFGIEGIRKNLNRPQGLILGSIIKPKVGLSAKDQAEVSYKLWKNGIDLVKDDENLTSMSFNKFDDRVKLVLAAKKRAEKETGQKKLYSCNVTAPYEEMVRRVELIKKHGGDTAMVDIVAIGFSGLQSLIQKNWGLVFHGHRAGHSAFTKNPRHGISMMVIAKLARLVGIDELHTGTVVGKMEGGAKDVVAINKVLAAPMHGLKSVLPIASGGMYPSLLPAMVKVLGEDVVVNFGGGIHGHPNGSAAGARAAWQARELLAYGISFNAVAGKKEFVELNDALKKWGK
jgi:ribulose-bisphosphate carboxylase large chain